VNSWKRDYGIPRRVRWWAGPLLLAAVALAFDAAKRRIPFGVWTTGPVDEVAHLCTAALGLLVLARFIAAPRRFYVAALVASVAIDLDHIPLYLGLLGNEGQRPVTHSLSTVALFAAAAVASRRHRAVLAGVATGLVLHFARDIAEGYPGVLVFWPLQDTSWMVSYRWFVGMIFALTAARLVLERARIPRTRVLVFGTPSPAGAVLRRQAFARPFSPCAQAAPLPDGGHSARPAEAQLSRQMPKAGEGDPRDHCADARESVKITPKCMAKLGQDAHGQSARDKGHFRS
jgi:inner membrane protein